MAACSHVWDEPLGTQRFCTLRIVSVLSCDFQHAMDQVLRPPCTLPIARVGSTAGKAAACGYNQPAAAALCGTRADNPLVVLLFFVEKAALTPCEQLLPALAVCQSCVGCCCCCIRLCLGVVECTHCHAALARGRFCAGLVGCSHWWKGTHQALVCCLCCVSFVSCLSFQGVLQYAPKYDSFMSDLSNLAPPIGSVRSKSTVFLPGATQCNV